MNKPTISNRILSFRLIALLGVLISLTLFAVGYAKSTHSVFTNPTWGQEIFSPERGVEAILKNEDGPLGPRSDTSDKSLMLEGSGYIEVNLPKSAVSDSWTLDAWIKPTAANTRRGILQIGDTRSEHLTLVITNEGKVECEIGQNKSLTKLTGDVGPLRANEWSHLAVTVSGGNAVLFIGGREVARGEAALTESSATILLGSVVEGMQRNNFRGLIDEIRIARFVRPQGFGYSVKNSVGTGLDDSYVGVWKFAGDVRNSIAAHLGQKTIGKIWYSSETFAPTQEEQVVDYCGTTQVTNSHCRRFDDGFPPYEDAATLYPDVSFTSLLSGTLFLTDNFTYSAGGESLPNTLSGYIPFSGSYYFMPLNVSFVNPVNNLSFRVLGLNGTGDYYAAVKITQQNGTITYRYLQNFGFAVPVDYYLGLTTCGSNNNEPCTNVTNLQIYQIQDPYGINFDNFSYTPAGQPTPNPTPTPTATPTPPYTSSPTNFVAKPEIGQVRLSWAPGATGADLYEVRRQGASGDVLLTTIQPGAPLEYVDRDVKIRHNLSYRVIARLNGTPSVPAYSDAAPKSPCDELPTVLPPDIGLPDVPFSGYGWTGKYSKGLSAVSVELNGRSLGHLLAVHYIKLKTSKMVDPQQIVLVAKEEHNPSSNGGFLSKSIGYRPPELTSFAVNMDTDYCVSSPSGQAAWFFSVNYIFTKTVPVDQCEPAAWLPCNRFYPLVSYWYESPVEFNETPEFVEVAQRLQFREGVNSAIFSKPNTIGLFQDCEYPVLPFVQNRLDYTCHASSFPIAGGQNPVEKEIARTVIRNGEKAGSFDNLHQTHLRMVDPPSAFPFVPAGCFSCVHDHWRWPLASSVTPPLVLPPRFPNPTQFRFGRPLIGWDYYNQVGILEYDVPKQDVDIGVVRFSTFDPWPPADFRDLVNGEPLGVSPVDPRGYNDFFYVATSREDYSSSDGKNRSTDIFHAHGGFFNPSYAGTGQPILRSSVKAGAKVKESQAFVDGPVSVTYERIYQDGVTSFTSFDATNTVLPTGYTSLTNTGHTIATTAYVSGDHTFKFKVESVSDPTIFGNLRILHAEFDEFDPHVPVWVDRTILAPDPNSPDFPTRTVQARSDSLGKFIIAVHNPTIPVPMTNLKIEGNRSPNPVMSDNPLTFNLLARNISSQTAHSVVLMHVLPPNVEFVSATPSQGSCRLGPDDAQLHEVPGFENRIYCQLGTLPANSDVPVSVVIIPREGESPYPPEGKTFSSFAAIKGAETDTDLQNNAVYFDSTVLPSLNAKPSVSILSPVNDAIFASPFQSQINLSVSILASDSDGSVAQVTVYDNDTLLGIATPSGSNQYQILLPTPTYGYHRIVARATDNGGRSSSSEPVKVLINGLSSFTITSPTSSLFAPGSNIPIETTSAVVSSRVQKVELYVAGSKLATLRQASGTGGITKHQYSWNNVPTGKHQLTAVLTEYSGAVSMAEGPMITVSSVPQIAVNTPTNGSTYQQVTVMPISAQISDEDGYSQKVDFYINGVLKKTNIGNVADGTSTFEWQDPPAGVYTLVVVATDNLGVEGASQPISFGINRPAPAPGELIWVDDQVPTGATTGGNDGWNWLNVNPVAFAGTLAHQSLLLDGLHEHFFENATQKLDINSGEELSAWVFIDPDFAPSEIMLQFNDGQSWEHRAYWGSNLIPLGTDGTSSRIRIGDMPGSGGWKHLRIPAAAVGLVGKRVGGIKFTLFGGRVAWDGVGKLTSAWTPPVPTADYVWIDDAPPEGATLETVNDVWAASTWISSNPPPHSGSLAHRHWNNDNNAVYRERSFKNPINPMVVSPEDTLFVWVRLYTANRPDTLVVQWYDDVSGWAHRAYWGLDSLDQIAQSRPMPGARRSTEGWRNLGPVPASNEWVRLEIPAAHVGLAGKVVRGMSFGIYKEARGAEAVWDSAGKTSAPSGSHAAVKYTTPLWRYHCGTGGGERLFYTTISDFNVFSPTCTTKVNIGYIYDYAAPGTVGLHVWHNSSDPSRRVLTLCTTPSSSCFYPGYIYGWQVGYVLAPPEVQTPASTIHKVWSCNNNAHFTTYPDGPDSILPSNCTFLYNLNYRVHTR